MKISFIGLGIMGRPMARNLIRGGHELVVSGHNAQAAEELAGAPMMLAHNFEPRFRIDLHIKDLVNALVTAEHVGADLPLTTSVVEMLRSVSADGHGRDDHSGLVQHYENLNHTRIGGTQP